MLTRAAAALLLLSLLLAACSGKRSAAVAPTFTPAPTGTGAAAAFGRRRPRQPVVASSCLQGLSSYRFSGSLSLRPAATEPVAGSTAVPSSAGGDAGAIAGSLANLLSNVTFQGSAVAPDRYQARVTFGGGGVQPLDVVRIGGQTFSRFGNGAWQQGDQISGFGGISRFDPQTLCQTLLAPLDAAGQTPVRETVNGVAALRYVVSGPRVGRALRFGARGAPRSAAATATAAAAVDPAQVTVWEAAKGGYPIRFQVDGGAASPISLTVDVTDLDGQDVAIAAPG